MSDVTCFVTTHKFSHCDCADESAKDAGLTFGTDQFESYVSGYQAGRASLEGDNAKLREALENCCAKMPDGLGDLVSEEFESQAVIEGRQALAATSPDEMKQTNQTKET